MQNMEIENKESASIAFELYQYLGRASHAFVAQKRQHQSMMSTEPLNFTLHDFMLSVLAFASTESISAIVGSRDKEFSKADMRDIINTIILAFRQQLEKDFVEITKLKKEDITTTDYVVRDAESLQDGPTDARSIILENVH